MATANRTKEKSNDQPAKSAKPKKGTLDEVTGATSTDAIVLALKYATSLVPAQNVVVGPNEKGTGLFVYVTDNTAAVRVDVPDPGFTVKDPFTIECDALRKALTKRDNAKISYGKGVLKITATGYAAEFAVDDAIGEFTVQPPTKDQIVAQLKMTGDLWAWLQTASNKLIITDLPIDGDPLFYVRVTDKAAIAATLAASQISFAAVKASAVGEVPPNGLTFMLPHELFSRIVRAVPYDNTSLTITESSIFLTMRSLRAQITLTASENNIEPSVVLQQIQNLPKIEGFDVELDNAQLATFLENAGGLSILGTRVVTFTKASTGNGAVAVCKASNGTVKAVVGGSCPGKFAIDLQLLAGLPKNGEGGTTQVRISAEDSETRVAVVKRRGQLPHYYATTLVGDE